MNLQSWAKTVVDMLLLWLKPGESLMVLSMAKSILENKKGATATR